MMIATDNNVKRAFQQMLDAAVDAFASPVPKPWAFGAAISFMTTTFVLTKQLATESRLPPVVEAAQKAVIADAVSGGRLVVTQPDATPNGIADPASANHRHLRNCFGHGNWAYDPAQVSSGSMHITLEDYDPRTRARTWAATMELPDLINLATKLLVETFNGMP
jgi:hypothetical protein